MDGEVISNGNEYSSFFEDVFKKQQKRKSIEELEKKEKNDNSKVRSNKGDKSTAPAKQNSRDSK